jgi:hypothetical protein
LVRECQVGPQQGPKRQLQRIDGDGLCPEVGLDVGLDLRDILGAIQGADQHVQHKAGAVLEPRLVGVGQHRIVRVVQATVTAVADHRQHALLKLRLGYDDARFQHVDAGKEVDRVVLYQFAAVPSRLVLIQVVHGVSG